MAATTTVVPVSVRNILVATDFSRTSHRALNYGLAIAHRYHSKLFLFHAVPRTRFPSSARQWENALASAWDCGSKLEKQLVAHGDLDGIENELIFRKGEVWDQMSAVIHDASIDLVVIGTQGRTGLAKFILGSVAETVFRNAACPVLTIGPGARKPRAQGAKQILVPTDFSPQSELAIPYALLLARNNQGGLTLLHVLEGPTEDKELNRQRAISTKFRLRDMARRAGILTYGTSLFVRCGIPAHQIVALAKEAHSDLIVMAVNAISRFSYRQAWPVAYAVACGAHCPVLSVRTERDC